MFCFLQQQPAEMGCLCCVPPCSTCSVAGEEPIKQGAEYKKETHSKSIRVCCYFLLLLHSKGDGGGEKQEMMQEHKTPKKKKKKKTPPRKAPACRRTRAQPKWLELKSAVSSLVLYPTLISNNSQQGRRDDYLERINQ